MWDRPTACLFSRPVMDRSHMRNMARRGDYLSCQATAGTFPIGSLMEASFSLPGAFTVLCLVNAALVPTGCRIRASQTAETLIESEQQWKLCRLSAWVVMPNHVHALLC